jgi:hypothetical protein
LFISSEAEIIANEKFQLGQGRADDNSPENESIFVPANGNGTF